MLDAGSGLIKISDLLLIQDLLDLDLDWVIRSQVSFLVLLLVQTDTKGVLLQTLNYSLLEEIHHFRVRHH